ncbi:MAG: protein kinase, partial [Planctomycetes bacterium]|nr:protein kinase [Planctomycetota bacterium]
AMPGYDITYRFAGTSVFGAHSWQLGRDVCLKILTLEEGSDPRLAKAFARQAKCLIDQKSAENLVPVLAVGKVSGLVLAVMERIHGESVASLIQRHVSLTWKLAVEISIEVARALRTVHGIGLPDRRLHPERILLSTDGSVRVSFCGLPRGLREGEVPLFSHPEALRGQPAVEASDVYVVGAILYYLATGEPPYPGTKPELVARAHLGGKPDLEKLSASGAPPSCATFVDRCLAKDPGGRYPNGAAVLASLNSIINNDAPGYVIGSCREVLAHLVRDEEKGPRAAQIATVEDPVTPARTGRRPTGAVPESRRRPTSLPSRRTAGGGRTPPPSHVAPPGIRSTSRPMARMKPPKKTPWGLILGLGGVGVVVLIAVVALLLSGGNGGPAPKPEQPPKPDTSGNGDGPPKNGGGTVDPPPALDAARLYAEADELESRGLPEEALAVWDRLIGVDREHKDALWRRANVLYGLGRGDEALRDIDGYLAAHAGHLEGLLLRARILDASGRADEALAAYAAVLSHDANHRLALQRHALLSEKRGDLVGTVEDYARMIALDPSNRELQQACLKVYNTFAYEIWRVVYAGGQSASDQEDALRKIDRVLATRVTNHYLVHLSRALVLLNRQTTERDREALADIDRAIQILSQNSQGANPDRGMAYAYRVAIQFRAKNPEAALADARRALADAAHGNWAWLAFRYLSLALKETDEKKSRAYELLALATSGYGKDEEAAVQKYLSENPDLSLAADAIAPFVESGGLYIINTSHPDWQSRGLAKGDQIRSYDGVAIQYPWELRKAILDGASKPGPALLVVFRQGQGTGTIELPRGEWQALLAVRMVLR